MTRTPTKPAAEKEGLHPRNQHRLGYDFVQLVRVTPELAEFVKPNPEGKDTINFADGNAVHLLNRALLRLHYGLEFWQLPAGYLCPPIPGRADYVHHLADLLAESNNKVIPRGPQVRVLDIGVGANCVYPIIGRHEYEWSFVGTESDLVALRAAQKIVEANPLLAGFVECRQQRTVLKAFRGAVKAGEQFTFCMCNPPFHSTAQAAAEGTLRKQRHLAGRTLPANTKAQLNFGGKTTELICPGGELGFITRMVAESAEFPTLCGWFSCLVSKSENLPVVTAALERVKAVETRILPMAQGQKKSRILAWHF